MAEQQFNTLKFDASQTIQTFENLAKAMDYYNRMGEKVVSVNQKFNAEGVNVATTMSSIAENGAKLTRSLKLVEGQVVLTGQSMKAATSNVQLNEHVQRWREYADAISRAMGPDQTAHVEAYRRNLEAALTVTSGPALNAHVKAWKEYAAAQSRAIGPDQTSHVEAYRRNMQNALTVTTGPALDAHIKQWKALNTEIERAARGPRQDAHVQQFRQEQRQQTRLSSPIADPNLHVQQFYREKRAQEALNAASTVATQDSHVKAFRKTQTELERHARAWERATTNITKSNNEATTKILIGWDNVIRFLQFRVIYTIGFAIANAMKKATAEITQFEIKVSEIRTLSQDNQQSFEAWTNQIVKLSNALGMPVEDVAKGLYETLSNQIAKGAEATKFMTQAMEFARVSVASTTDSVNLLSSVLNSYNIKASETERVSAILFRTIDLGRVTASEMANTIGRILPTSAALGIKLEEVSAAVASLTIKGIRYNEAFTLINNVMLKLVHPSQELQAVFDKWGVSTGEAAVQTFGWIGVLRKLQQETRNSTTEISYLFKEMRSGRGGRALIQGLADYEKTLADMTNNSLPKYREASKIAMESSGVEVVKQLNRLRNSAMLEWGKPFLDALAGRGGGGPISGIIGGLVKHFGGLQGTVMGVVKWFKILVGVFIYYKVQAKLAEINTILLTKANNAAAIATRYNAEANRFLVGQIGTATRASAALTSGMKSLKSAMSFLMSPGVLIGAGIIAISALISKWQEEEEAVKNAGDVAVEAFRKQNTEMNKIADDEHAFRLRLVQEAVDKEFQVRSQGIANLRAMVSKVLASEKEGIKEQGKLLKDTFEVYIKAIEHQITLVEQRANKAADVAKQARDRVAQLQESSGERREALGLKGLQPEAEINERKRLAALYRQSGSDLLAQAQKATDPEQAERFVREAAKKFEKAYQYIDSVMSKRDEIQDKIDSIKKDLTGLGAKGAGRDDVTAEITKLHQLEAARKAAHTKSKDILAADAAIRAQQEKIRQLREQGRDAGDADKQKELQGKLTDLEKQKAALGDIATAQKAVNDMEKEQITALQAIAALQDAAAAKAKAQADAARLNAEKLRTILTDLAGFELKGKTEQELKDSLAGFDKKVTEAVGFGLTDQGVFLELQKFRVRIQRQADLELKNNRLLILEEQLTAEKKKIEDFQKDLGEGRAKTRDWTVANLESVLKQVGPLLARRRADLDVGQKAPEEVRQRVEGNAYAVDLALQTLRAIQQGQDVVVNLQRELATLQKPKTAFDVQRKATIEQELAFRRQSLKEDPQVVIQRLEAALAKLTDPAYYGKTEKIGDVPLPDLVKELSDTLPNLKKAFEQQKLLEQKQAEYEKTLTSYNGTLAQVAATTAQVSGIMKQFGGEFSKALQESAQRLRDLQKEIITIGQQLQLLLPGQKVPVPAPYNPTTPVPTAPAAPGAPRASNTFGNINVNVYPGPGGGIDPTAVAGAIRNGIRTGALAPLA